MTNILDNILQEEKDLHNYLRRISRRDALAERTDGMIHQWDENKEGNKFEVFSSGSDLWFFYCGNSR